MKKAAAFLLATSLLAPARAQTPRKLDISDLPPEKKQVFPYRTFQTDLPNGLRVVIVPTDFPRLVAMEVVMQVGSRNEVDPGRTGFAHFFEHMMFRGTPRFSPAKGRLLLKGFGINDNAWTWDDLTVYHKVFSKEDLEPVLDFEADRFQNLKYTQDDLKTESKAVLGEFNKNSSDPQEKLREVLQDTAFSRHTYKHTTMGFLADVENMPNQFDYSRQFFERFYRPGNATVVLVGDVDPDQALRLVTRYFGSWQAGPPPPPIPPEPAPQGPKSATVEWPTNTAPWVCVAYHVPAYTDSGPETAALRLIASLAFSENSELYKKLVLRDSVVDRLEVDGGDHRDPFLFCVSARLKDGKKLAQVTAAITAECERLGKGLVNERQLRNVKSHLTYEFSLRLDNSQAIAAALAIPIGLRRSPYTINQLYQEIEKVTPEQLRDVAARVFQPAGRVTVTLTRKASDEPATGER